MARLFVTLIGSDAKPPSERCCRSLDEPAQNGRYLTRRVTGIVFGVLALGMVGSGDASVYPNYPLDQLLFSDRLPDSGKGTETRYFQDWLDAIVNPLDPLHDTQVEFDYTLNRGDTSFNVSWNDDNSWYIDVAPDEPGFFALKFWVPRGRAFRDLPDTFYFLNIADLTKLVFSNDQVDNYTGGRSCAFRGKYSCNIGKLSHYTILARDGSELLAGVPEPIPLASVPEPMTLALFGLGLAGLGAVRRRRAA